MNDEPEHGTKVTDNSKEASDELSEHASKLASAVKRGVQSGDFGEVTKETAKVVGYGAQVAGHLYEGN